jgi:hypothetical protein
VGRSPPEYGSASPWPKAINEIIYRHLLDKAQAVDDLLASFGRHLTARGVDPALVEAAMSLASSQRDAITDDLCSLAVCFATWSSARAPATPSPEFDPSRRRQGRTRTRDALRPDKLSSAVARSVGQGLAP